MNILFVTSEVAPFAKTGGLGDVSEALPVALNEAGQRCAVISPLYSLVKKNGYKPKPLKAGIPLQMGGKKYEFDLSVIVHKNTEFIFIGNEELYGREHIYGTPEGDYEDSHIRFGFFSKAVLASMEYLGRPDIIHCNDWQTGLIPVYIKILNEKDANLKNIRVLFTIHNIAYQGLFPKDALSAIDIPDSVFNDEGISFFGKANFLKAGIVFSDIINTVSEGYKREIMTEEYGCGLDGILRKRAGDFSAILNGADYSTWNPATDLFIVKTYEPASLDLKEECKKDLLKEFGIPHSQEAPLIGMVTRLAGQKGVDTVAEAIDDILALGANFVILGTGEEEYNELFLEIGKKYKGRIGIGTGFNDSLAHRIEAGSDIFLMPSRYEPCGLSQMYSLKYGTVPIVRATGGLDDTIEDFDPQTLRGNGFKFRDPTKGDMLSSVRRAIEVFKDKKVWRRLQLNGMECDFSWARSAAKYMELYRKLYH